MASPIRRTVPILGYRLKRTPCRTWLQRQVRGCWSWLGSCERPVAGALWRHRREPRVSREAAERALCRCHGAPVELLPSPDVAPRSRTVVSGEQLELLGTGRAR